jgi:ribonuclease D
MKYSYIDNNEKVTAFLDDLQKNKTQAVCMDFEGEFNQHCYGEKLCLIQVFDGHTFSVIDPFHIDNNELVRLFKHPVVKLFFSAGSDRKLAFNQYGVRIRSLLDMSDLLEVLGIQHKGLDAILHEILSVSVGKKTSYQRFNWTIRPLPEHAIQYALSDVRYLFDLERELLSRIAEQNLIEDLAHHLARADFDYEKKSIPSVKKKTRYRKLNQRGKKVFDTVFMIRDKSARKLDKPPNSVMSNEQVFRIAENTLEIENVRFDKVVPMPARKTLINEISAAISSNLST